jgi:catechol 2,3-dioxygenase-like lactoylglutathione lyase family enzyme
MFNPKSAFSGFGVTDIDKAKEFYGTTLGLELADETGGTRIVLPDGNTAWMYPKSDMQPANSTMLNFMVDDIDVAIDALVERGVTFEHYEGSPQDEKGIMRGKEHNMGPNIAWFKDPTGNILSVIEE